MSEVVISLDDNERALIEKLLDEALEKNGGNDITDERNKPLIDLYMKIHRALGEQVIAPDLAQWLIDNKPADITF